MKRMARQIVVFAVGGAVILVGVAMIVLPGPAFVVIPAGLAIMAVEFHWARRLLDALRRTASGFRQRFRAGLSSAD